MVDLYPSQKFWESNLEISVCGSFNSFNDLNVRKNWLNSLSGRQLSVILRHFKDKQNEQLFKDYALWKSDDFSIQQKHEMLFNSEYLFNYYLVSRFSHRKSEISIIEVARSILSEDHLKPFLLRDNKYDKKSLLFTLFTTDHNVLKQIFLFNQVQKKGFSPFALVNPPRQKPVSFETFLSESTIQEILKQHDLSEGDNFESQFQAFFCHKDRIYLSIRRASRDEDLLMSSNKVIHGYKPNHIILDFSFSANQVNLYSKDMNQGLKIAGSIVSHYFEQKCLFFDMQSKNPVAQVSYFMNECIKNYLPNIRLFEVKCNLPQSNTYLTVNTSDNNIEELLQKIEPAVGSILHNVSLIQHVKVLFKNKKVTLSFQVDMANENYIVIDYSEYVLNKKEREDFKSLVKDNYGIVVLSKAKALSR